MGTNTYCQGASTQQSFSAFPVSYMHFHFRTCAPTFGILEFRVAVDTSVANVAVSRVENVCQFAGLEGARHTTDEHRLTRIDGLSVVHDEVTVREKPGTNLHLREGGREGGRQREEGIEFVVRHSISIHNK